MTTWQDPPTHRTPSPSARGSRPRLNGSEHRAAGATASPSRRPGHRSKPAHRRKGHPLHRRWATADQGLAAVLVAYLVAALLGSDSLVGLAERQQLGWQRDVALSAAHGFDRFSDALSLDRPARWAHRALGHEVDQIDVDSLIQPVTTTTAPVAAPTTTTPVPRVPTVDQPLRVYVGGDSMARELANGLARTAPADLVTVQNDHQVSSGLSRPDYYDWPQRLAHVLTEEKPDVIVLIFGSNDAQNVQVGGRVLEAGSPEWLADYRTRVARVMDLVNQPGTRTVWVGLPPMRGAGYDRDMSSLDTIYREEASTRPWVSYVPTRQQFAGGDGSYVASIDEGGGPVELRQDDGVHWSIAGSERVGRLAYGAFAPLHGLTPAAVANN